MAILGSWPAPRTDESFNATRCSCARDPPMIRRRVGISLLAFSPHTLAGQGTYTIGVTRALVSRRVHDYIVLLPPQHEGLWRELLPDGSSLVICGPDPDDRLRRVVFEHRHL